MNDGPQLIQCISRDEVSTSTTVVALAIVANATLKIISQLNQATAWFLRHASVILIRTIAALPAQHSHIVASASLEHPPVIGGKVKSVDASKELPQVAAARYAALGSMGTSS